MHRIRRGQVCGFRQQCSGPWYKPLPPDPVLVTRRVLTAPLRDGSHGAGRALMAGFHTGQLEPGLDVTIQNHLCNVRSGRNRTLQVFCMARFHAGRMLAIVSAGYIGNRSGQSGSGRHAQPGTFYCPIPTGNSLPFFRSACA